jgi:phage protein U
MFALLGEIFFEVLTSPEAFRSTSGYTYAVHKVVEAAPRLQWLANDLQKILLEVGFHVSFTDPATQMNMLYAVAQNHHANPLVFGNGVFRGYFVIDSIQETFQQLAGDGSYIAVSARVELREWVPGADFDPQAPARPTTPPLGILQRTSSSTQVFDFFQEISSGNPAPASEIVQLSGSAVYGGVTYSAADYSQPGVSGLVSSGPVTTSPGTFTNVGASTIVRAE